MPMHSATLESDVDLFSDVALNDPYPLYRALRERGPAVRLTRHDVWFLGRYDQVRAALADWRTFSSARGIGLNPVINDAWANALICVDPPVHTHMRKFVNERLGPRHLKPMRKQGSRQDAKLAKQGSLQSSWRPWRSLREYSSEKRR